MPKDRTDRTGLQGQRTDTNYLTTSVPVICDFELFLSRLTTCMALGGRRWKTCGRWGYPATGSSTNSLQQRFSLGQVLDLNQFNSWHCFKSPLTSFNFLLLFKFPLILPALFLLPFPIHNLSFRFIFLFQPQSPIYISISISLSSCRLISPSQTF